MQELFGKIIQLTALFMTFLIINFFLTNVSSIRYTESIDFTIWYSYESEPVKEKNMYFGEYIRKKRLSDERELTMQDVADHLGISLSYMSAIENRHKPPFDGDKLESLAKFLQLSDDETAMMFDLAGRENREVPYDLQDTFMYDEVGDLARYALRQSKAGFIKEEDWKSFIREMEAKKRIQK